MFFQDSSAQAAVAVPVPAVDPPPFLEATLQTFLPESLDGSAATIASWITGVCYALGIFIVGWLVSKWIAGMVRRVLKARGVDPSLVGFLSALVQWFVLAAVAVSALGKLGIQTTSLVALVGAGGLAIGLALQGSLGNFAAGVMILLFRPFVVGHKITAAGHTGVVEDVGLFASTLSTPNSDTIIIPNAEIMSSSIVNHAVQGHYRCNVAIGVAYGTDYEQAERVIIDAMKKLEVVLEDPAPSVALSGFGASSVDLQARPWCHPDNVPSCEHQTRIAIYKALDEAGIEIPFDQVVVHKAAS
jgi:small conductance mechanosensitive channel